LLVSWRRTHGTVIAYPSVKKSSTTLEHIVSAQAARSKRREKRDANEGA